MAYKLKIGTAQPATLASLGITAAKLDADIEARSSLTLETPAALGSAQIIAPFQRVLLYDGADNVRFVGWLDEAPRSARGDAHRVTYRLSGPHRWLARANFVQSRGGLVILGGAAGTQSSPTSWHSAFIGVVDSALASYPEKFGYATQHTFFHEIPARLRADVDCLTALLSLVSFAPTVVFWWSYDNDGNPTLNLGNGVGSADKTLSTATHAISSAEVNPRYDLLADVVKVYFVSGNVVSGEEVATSAGDAAALGANRTVLFSYDTTALNNIPSAGIAGELAAWHQTLHIDASATRHDVDWTDRPGHIYGFGGADLSLFAGYKSILHTIIRDLFAETTTLRLGIIPGKALFKINDLDQGGGNNVTHAAAPVFSAAQVDRLKDIATNLTSGSGPLQIPDIEGLEEALENTTPPTGLTIADIEGLQAALDAKLTVVAPIGWKQVERCDAKKLTILADGDWV